MTKFYLEIPSTIRKNDAIEYLEEHIKYHSYINGTNEMHKIIDNSLTYEGWLEECEKRKDKEYAYSIDRVPSETYFLVREDDNKIIGMISIRYDLTEKYLQFSGHIGYGIRPTERRKGYNKINLYLALLIAQKLNLPRVMLVCDADNPGSYKTIEALGGILERKEIDPFDNELTNVYWINVDESITKYQSTYEEFISHKPITKKR